ncbi:hypothetical protein ES703_115204 [subsurface metagenome]
MIHVGGNIFAIAYRGPKRIELKTVDNRRADIAGRSYAKSNDPSIIISATVRNGKHVTRNVYYSWDSTVNIIEKKAVNSAVCDSAIGRNGKSINPAVVTRTSISDGKHVTRNMY